MLLRTAISLVCLTLILGCPTVPTQRRAGVLEYLYPEGTEARPPQDVQLELPVRVGIAFVPQSSGWSQPLDAAHKKRLLDRVADAFREEEEIQAIEVVPESYMVESGGFANLEQLRGLFGCDLIVLVSYDQTQVDEMNKASITYWTIVGAYVVPGNVNETHTLVDASVFDIRSRALLFNSSGRSRIEGKATAIDSARVLREDAVNGFELAVEDMIADLETGLAAFREQVKAGTVRGAGTPAVTVASPEASGGGGGVGAGAVGPFEAALGLLLVAGGWAGRRRRPARGRSAEA